MTFVREVELAAKQINTSVVRAGEQAVQGWFNRTIRKTPVDTGRLRGNWQVSKSVPIEGKLDRKGGAGSISDVRRVVKKPAVYWLTNNLPYAPVVEYGRFGTGALTTSKTAGTGFSIQAPAGMARISLIEIRAKLRQLGFK